MLRRNTSYYVCPAPAAPQRCAPPSRGRARTDLCSTLHDAPARAGIGRAARLPPRSAASRSAVRRRAGVLPSRALRPAAVVPRLSRALGEPHERWPSGATNRHWIGCSRALATSVPDPGVQLGATRDQAAAVALPRLAKRRNSDEVRSPEPRTERQIPVRKDSVRRHGRVQRRVL